ncbi:PD-(D/E)XK nuclease family protein [Glaciimonas sp. PAMC28666]|uniref:PD-(D/E)XK nuclease family protein n=1 Tax=Glaciimonas sp. PAMC28666 TaxID=2807626 RepID=UPI00196337AF|nr:PD-(D/E)XK nuclease family protein [Glaciimonas sp. PAMC28666]QRX81118.1 PD-(D/E)XK nuclease family protein [Glaciimonas sp. PAMC28666]
MLSSSFLQSRLTQHAIPPSNGFWPEVARVLSTASRETGCENNRDLSGWRVIVPAFAHAHLLKGALGAMLPGAFIPPRINTLSALLDTLPPAQNAPTASSGSERLMRLYSELRQHAWLKKIFTARRNTDLLPLAQTLLSLSDELTQALLPSMQNASDAAARWQAALEQLTPSSRQLLSDETQLVWSIWKSQLDGDDALAVRFEQMLQFAAQANAPLAWISSVEPEPMERAFLHAYAQRQPVLLITLDWQAGALASAYAIAWPELIEAAAEDENSVSAPPDDLFASPEFNVTLPSGIALCPTQSIEDEAVQGAQTVLDWLQAGKMQLAIVAQDRVVARRIRALLERAQVHVADETGWKLSTTRAASAIAAWFDLVTQRGETTALLDFLKSPFVLTDLGDKPAQVMAIEVALRRANVLGEWNSVIHALTDLPEAQNTVARLAQQANLYAGRKTLRGWINTGAALDALGMTAALTADPAGQQVLLMLHNIAGEEAPERGDESADTLFSFPEWRALVNLQMDETSFISPASDRRVVMLPLNGARLRHFDAVLLVGADSSHLPSQPQETLFFANTVRRELDLATRESRQRQQMRDVAELLAMNPLVVLSWQAHQDGEPNPASPWIERLQLTLAQSGAAALPRHRAMIAERNLMAIPAAMPAPVAGGLRPARLSSSGYNSFVSCPYQFFAQRMLRLTSLDELSDMPEKRDYGGWLHEILETYHETIRDQSSSNQDDAYDQRVAILVDISKQLFDKVIAKNAAALGFYARWQKVISAYVVWANEREANGWHFVFGEQAYEKLIQLRSGELTLHGRIDRIDENEAGERAVLDYKSNSVVVLNKKLKDHEDHQLAFYGLLSDVPVDAAHYVALETTKDKIGDVAAQDYEEAKRMLEVHIKDTMQAISDGAPLVANGTESVCQYCDVRGLCRKGAW